MWFPWLMIGTGSKRWTLLARVWMLLTALALLLLIQPAPPARATVADGCWTAYADVTVTRLGGWPAGLADAVAARWDSVGPNSGKGSPACPTDQQPFKVRADQLGMAGSSTSIRAMLYSVDLADSNSCRASVVDASHVALESIAMDVTPNSQPVGTAAVYGLVQANAAVLSALKANEPLVLEMNCTYGSTATNSSFNLGLPLTSLAVPVNPFPGVSINSGNAWTNTTSVSLDLSWDGLADQVAISNDGGFAGASIRPLTSNTASWVLAAAADERLPKIVYVRYHTAAGWSGPYSDDIILDTTAPTVTGAIATAPAGAATTNLVLRAADNRSGVAAMQSVLNAPSASATTTRFASNLTVPATARVVYTRVRDGAGNWSAWRATWSPRATATTAAFRQISVPRHASATLQGMLIRAVSGTGLAAQPVKLQRWTGSAWKIIASRNTSSTGAYSFSFTATATSKFRVVYSGSALLLSSSSKPRVLSVR